MHPGDGPGAVRWSGPAPIFVSDLQRGIIAIDGSSGAQTIVTNQVKANSITALPAGNLFVTGDQGGSSSRGVYRVDVGAGTATLVTLLAGARAIARINSDTFLVATSDQLYKMTAGGSLTTIGDPARPQRAPLHRDRCQPAGRQRRHLGARAEHRHRR